MADKNKQSDGINSAFAKQRLHSATRHVFLCTGPDCCKREDGLATWQVLKEGIRELNLTALRSKADCLRICVGGPWLVVYPEGIWYGGVTPERCQRIIREHLLEGRPIREWIVREHSLDHEAVKK
ncbi:MAG: (2Fe-2S) ferredoxin domain-containing protein [Opitutales bacterium]